MWLRQMTTGRRLHDFFVDYEGMPAEGLYLAERDWYDLLSCLPVLNEAR